MKKGKQATERIELGEYIVADPEICHGKPTFKGTRIMVWQVYEDLAEGRSWDFICNQRWGGRIPLGARAEAIRLAQEAWLERYGLAAPEKPRRFKMPEIQARLERTFGNNTYDEADLALGLAASRGNFKTAVSSLNTASFKSGNWWGARPPRSGSR